MGKKNEIDVLLGIYLLGADLHNHLTYLLTTLCDTIH